MPNFHHKKGAILILTLWVVALLSLMAHGIMLRARLGIREAEWADIELQARQLTCALTSLAVDRLAQDENPDVDSFKELWGRTYTAESSALMAEFAGNARSGPEYQLEIIPVDESGKVNINLASLDLLTAILREYGAGLRSPDIAKAIIDWRDQDDIGPAERDLYQNFDPPYAPSDADLKSIDELLFIQGVDPSLFFGEDANHNGLLDPNEDDGDAYWPDDNMDGQLQPGLADAFTVYGDGSININTTPLPVLRAVIRLGLDDDPAADSWADSLLAKRQGPDKIDGTDDDTPFESQDQFVALLAGIISEDTPAQALRLASPFSVTTNAFRFFTAVRFPDKHYSMTAEIVIIREGDQLNMIEYHDGL